MFVGMKYIMDIQNSIIALLKQNPLYKCKASDVNTLRGFVGYSHLMRVAHSVLLQNTVSIRPNERFGNRNLFSWYKQRGVAITQKPEIIV